MQTEKILVHAPQGVPTQLLAEYLNRCHSALAAVKEALHRSDHGHTRIFGHRLRGTGGAYGVPRLTEMGALIEAASSIGDMAELGRQVAALEEYLGRIEIAAN